MPQNGGFHRGKDCSDNVELAKGSVIFGHPRATPISRDRYSFPPERSTANQTPIHSQPIDGRLASTNTQTTPRANGGRHPNRLVDLLNAEQ